MEPVLNTPTVSHIRWARLVGELPPIRPRAYRALLRSAMETDKALELAPMPELPPVFVRWSLAYARRNPEPFNGTR